MSTTIGPFHFLLVGAALFFIGCAGAIVRRNALVVLMSIELMLNAANVVFIGFARQYGHAGGHVFAFLIMAIAAAEAAVGLSILVGVYRTRQSIELDELDSLRDET